MNNFNGKIVDFVNEMVNKKMSENDLRKALISYKSFLINTKLVSKKGDMSDWLDKVIGATKIIIGFRESYGSVDIVTLIESINVYNNRSVEVKPDLKHYGHYHEEVVDSCTSRVNNDRCGQSRVMVSSCGSSVSTDRC